MTLYTSICKIFLSLVLNLLSYFAEIDQKKEMAFTDTVKADSTILSFDFKTDKNISFFYRNYYGETSAPIDINCKTKKKLFRLVFDKEINFFLLVDNTTKTFIIYPGEQVEIYIGKNDLIRVTNNQVRTNEVNFISSLNKKIGIDLEGYYTYRPTTDQKTIKIISDATKIYNERISYLDEYAKNNLISVLFKTNMKNKISSIYYNDVTRLYIGGLKKIDSDIEKFIALQKNIVLDSNHIDDRAMNYISFVSMQQCKCKPSLENLFNAAITEYTGKTRDMVLFKIILLAFKQNNKFLNSFIEKFNSVSSDIFLRKYLQENFLINDKSKSIDNYDNSELITPDGKVITWKSFILSKRDTVVYVDFWASWCAPCLLEMPNSNKLKEYFKNEKISVVYISIDDINTAWRNALNGNEIYKHKTNNFRLRLGNKSKIKEYFKIYEIPRYMLIDKKGILRFKNASRPSDTETYSVVRDLLKSES